MNKITIFFVMALVALGLNFTACDKDDPIKFEDVEVKNAELKAVLVKQGFTFNAAGQLVLDEKAQNIIKLDLSGTKISDLSGLDVFPKLIEVDLSDNGYGSAFDFSLLPSQITAIDLTGNNIYEFDKLITVKIEENGDESITPLRSITKLYLPETAKDNIDVLMRFYRENKSKIEDGTIDMKMADDKGTLQKYTTLRNIPDQGLRAYLKETFSDMFTGDQIDINKRFGNAQKTSIVNIAFMSVSSFEGLQYITNHPYWEGMGIGILSSEKVKTPRIKIGKHTTTIYFSNLDASAGIDFSEADMLKFIHLEGIDGIESIDLGASPIWGQGNTDIEGDNSIGSRVNAIDCPSLKEIILPAKDKLYAYQMDLECLPALESIDLSKIQMLYGFFMGDLPTKCKITYPNLTDNYQPWDEPLPTYFVCSESTYNRSETTAFINKYYDKANKVSKSPGIVPTFQGLNCPKNTAIEWENK